MANFLTCLRIPCGIALIFCTPFSPPFYLFYLLGGLTDLLDGFVARRFHKETKLGAQLDTFADTVFLTIVFVKTIPSLSIPLWLIVWAVCIALIKGINLILGFILLKRFVAEHTAMNKICGILLFSLPLLFGFFPNLPIEPPCIPICVLATFAALEEGNAIRIGKEIG